LGGEVGKGGAKEGPCHKAAEGGRMKWKNRAPPPPPPRWPTKHE